MDSYRIVFINYSNSGMLRADSRYHRSTHVDCGAINLKTRLLTFIFGLLLAGTVHAGPILDTPILDTPILGGSLLVATDGAVKAKFLGSDAGYFNTLYLKTDADWGTGQIFDKGTPLDTVVNLGIFDAGTELVFRLFVRNTSLDFFSGDPSRNIDGVPHARAVTTLLQDGSYLTTVGFEDLFDGGDRDYNDFMFSLTNVVDPPAQVPEPSVLLLLGFGLVGLYFQRRTLRLYQAGQYT